jgi:uncharacterized protein YgiM (DUF1202 family)
MAAQDLAELKRLASDGAIGPVDLIQPPGASEWLYAQELPELAPSLRPNGNELEASSGGGTLVKVALCAVFLGVTALSSYGMYHFTRELQNADLELLNTLELTEMLVTSPSLELKSEPKEGASGVGNTGQNAKVQLLAKRGPWYQVRTAEGAEGWVTVDSVVPAYLFADKETQEDYDPIYNPDRYVFVKNSNWMQLPEQQKQNITVFQFQLQNKSKFEMEGLVLAATIKDKGDRVLETVEIAIEGSIPAFEGTSVGTLAPDKKDKEGQPRRMTSTAFRKLAETDPTLNERWTEGIEVKMVSEGFVEANIDLVQIRAVPKKIE